MSEKTKYRTRTAHWKTLNMKLRRKRRAALIEQLKMVPCARCKVSYPSCVMDFHHVPGRGQKKFQISRNKCLTLTALLEEVAKCDVLCANCHRLHHYTDDANT
jgi:hypothetical protein